MVSPDRPGPAPVADETLFRRSDDVLARQIAGECILVPIRGNLADMERIFAINPVGETVWGFLDEECRFDDLRDRLVRRFGIDSATAGEDLAEFLEALEREGLVLRR